MKRTRMRKPEEIQSPDLTLDSIYYCPQDLYVGAIVEFLKHTFLLTSADEYVFSYMERPKEVETFPQSNLRIIMDEVVRCVSEKVKCQNVLIVSSLEEFPPLNSFCSLVRQLFKFSLHKRNIFAETII